MKKNIFSIIIQLVCILALILQLKTCVSVLISPKPSENGPGTNNFKELKDSCNKLMKYVHQGQNRKQFKMSNNNLLHLETNLKRKCVAIDHINGIKSSYWLLRQG